MWAYGHGWHGFGVETEPSQQVISSKYCLVLVASYYIVVGFPAKALVSGACSQPEWQAAGQSVPPDR